MAQMSIRKQQLKRKRQYIEDADKSVIDFYRQLVSFHFPVISKSNAYLIATGTQQQHGLASRIHSLCEYFLFSDPYGVLKENKWEVFGLDMKTYAVRFAEKIAKSYAAKQEREEMKKQELLDGFRKTDPNKKPDNKTHGKHKHVQQHHLRHGMGSHEITGGAGFMGLAQELRKVKDEDDLVGPLSNPLQDHPELAEDYAFHDRDAVEDVAKTKHASYRDPVQAEVEKEVELPPIDRHSLVSTIAKGCKDFREDPQFDVLEKIAKERASRKVGDTFTYVEDRTEMKLPSRFTKFQETHLVNPITGHIMNEEERKGYKEHMTLDHERGYYTDSEAEDNKMLSKSGPE